MHISHCAKWTSHEIDYSMSNAVPMWRIMMPITQPLTSVSGFWRQCFGRDHRRNCGRLTFAARCIRWADYRTPTSRAFSGVAKHGIACSTKCMHWPASVIATGLSGGLTRTMLFVMPLRVLSDSWSLVGDFQKSLGPLPTRIVPVADTTPPRFFGGDTCATSGKRCFAA